jgi:hypothetical protein
LALTSSYLLPAPYDLALPLSFSACPDVGFSYLEPLLLHEFPLSHDCSGTLFCSSLTIFLAFSQLAVVSLGYEAQPSIFDRN